MTRFYIRALLLILTFLPFIGYATVPAWQIVPKESSITFTGKMNNVPTKGTFKSFDGDIYFDPNNLKESHARITIDTASISTSYVDIGETLKTTDWFNAKSFPHVIFTTSSFEKLHDKTYEAKGTLTIREKTLPVTLTFTEEENTKNKVRIKGSTQLKRTAFEVGQGEWKSTDEVADEVQVDFVVTATKK
ncbi:MAG: hypothetical protein ACD_60C00038G0010 [uncultured bacterium]|nr:MAG: hypothetical protein ACD_60C00038G0010 [uncultured bacterium]